MCILIVGVNKWRVRRVQFNFVLDEDIVQHIANIECSISCEDLYGSCWAISYITVAGISGISGTVKPLMEEVLVGLLLGDGWLEKQKVNARLIFEQSHLRKEFFFFIF